MANRYLSVIAQVVAQMTGVTAFSAARVCEQLLAQLVEHFEADSAFLRHNNHRLRASMLFAEWPPRDRVTHPDQLAMIYFGDAGAELAEDLKTPTVIRADAASVVAVAPLLWGTLTTGVIGLAKSGGKRWAPEELEALGVVALLFAQLQAHIAAESRLERLADCDELTGLLNRRALTAKVRYRLRPARPGPVAALYIDLDRLKTINDHLGHAAGDVVIRSCARRLAAKVGHEALIARVGGDEFVVIPNRAMSAEAAETMAHTLQDAVRDPVRIGGELITRTASIGVAVGMPGVDTTDDLLRRADHAALAAKRNGGNAVAVFNPDASMQGAARDAGEPVFPGGVDSDAVLRYQPEIDLRTGEVLAAEALACWHQPTRGLVLVDAFDGTAESMRLSGRLGRWVMRRACDDFSRWRSHGIGSHATLRLNISPAQLANDGFAESVAAIIDEFGIDAGSVCLEIHERAILRDIQNTHTTLARLKDVGVQIAIDGFGRGDVVLSHLRSLPVDMLKIRTGFIRDLGTSTADLAVVQAIVGLAAAVGLQLTAEGVETPIAAKTLLRHGCNRAQGHLLSGPVTDDGMESLLSRRRIALPFAPADASAAPFATENLSAVG
ncbi:MAG TPA: bifunctional diguanylate cyclase/phosphodiesterase [Mycobacterium sp.]|nr:bifunctional diguanylate cyclase/phosphodiesterase [Mycobacterium sp.]